MRELPAAPVLVYWHSAPYIGGTRHAFVGPFRSLCEKLRWSARLAAPDPDARQCEDCVRLVRVAAAAVLDGVDVGVAP